MNIVTKFNKGDRAYYVVNSTARIYPVTVTWVFLGEDNTVCYDLQRDNGMFFQDVPEDTVYTFPEAKTALTEYLQEKLTEVSNLVAN